jgi:hypothetical protein
MYYTPIVSVALYIEAVLTLSQRLYYTAQCQGLESTRGGLLCLAAQFGLLSAAFVDDNKDGAVSAAFFASRGPLHH